MAPRVYAMAQKGDLNGEGALISADVIDLRSNRLTNSGTIAGRKLTLLNTESLLNEGAITGDKVGIKTTNNFDSIGGKVEAERALLVDVGGDLNHESTTMTTNVDLSHFQRSETTLGRKALFHVKGEDGQLQLSSNNLNAKGADIINDGNGNTLVQSKNNMNLTALSVGFDEKMGKGNHYRHEKVEEAVVSQVKGKGNVLLTGKNILSEGAQLDSEAKLMAIAENDLVLNGAKESRDFEEFHKTKSGSVAKVTKTSLDKQQSVTQVGTQVSGKDVVLSAGHDVKAKGIQAIADDNLHVQAGHDVDIAADTNHFKNKRVETKKTSGVFTGGGIGITFGSQKQTAESDETKRYAQSSQVGSLNGNTTMIAKDTYTQTASAVSAIKGDVNILAKKADIKAADDKYETNTKQKFEQKGLTIAITSPIISAIQAVQGAIESTKQVGDSKHDRVNTMSAANAGFEAYRAYQSGKKAVTDVKDFMNGEGDVDSLIGVQITYGQQKSESHSHTEGKTAYKSQVNAGGKVNIMATGAGKDSNINIEGSDISGKQGTTLIADNQVNIKATEQNHQERSTNKSSGFNAGVAIKVSNGAAAGVTLGGNYGKGYGNGDETSYVASHVGDSQSKTVINAGGDANLIGSQVKGKRVEVNAQNLNIESLQDTATYKGKQMNGSGSVTVGYGASVGGSFNKSNIHADHASVNEQAGIYAGDEGYDINVNHTDLKGGLITSTQKADGLVKRKMVFLVV